MNLHSSTRQLISAQNDVAPLQTKMGELRLADFMRHTQGQVRGQVVSDAKIRHYAADYEWTENGDGTIAVQRRNRATSVNIPCNLDLTGAFVAFLGFYSGDGAKGSESTSSPGHLSVNISVSQIEPKIIDLSMQQLRYLFGNNIRFTFSLGEDSAYFLAGDGETALREYYGGSIPARRSLSEVRPNLDAADQRYLDESRQVEWSNEEYLAFYYQHKDAMREILTAQKESELRQGGVVLQSEDQVTASLRRPFKKGARLHGGSSRADEMHVGGVNGFGELLLKILHEIEDTILQDDQISTQGLVVWNDTPSLVGEAIDIRRFFDSHPYGEIADKRASWVRDDGGTTLAGQWRGSNIVEIRHHLRIDPLWCYTSGLYLAEGSTSKKELCRMYSRGTGGFSLSFTSSENTSLELVIRTLATLFPSERCVETWKIKVGSQYFPELVVNGLKQGVPMLRGGNSGDGKMRTMEISLAIKNWAIEVAPCLQPYSDRYSHVEPTGAGVPRIDFSASSSLCKWFFPLMMYAVFGTIVDNPKQVFCE